MFFNFLEKVIIYYLCVDAITWETYDRIYLPGKLLFCTLHLRQHGSLYVDLLLHNTNSIQNLDAYDTSVCISQRALYDIGIQGVPKK